MLIFFCWTCGSLLSYFFCESFKTLACGLKLDNLESYAGVGPAGILECSELKNEDMICFLINGMEEVYVRVFRYALGLSSL